MLFVSGSHSNLAAKRFCYKP